MGNGTGGLRPSNFDIAAFNDGDTLLRRGGAVVAAQLQPTNQGGSQKLFSADAPNPASTGTYAAVDATNLQATFFAPYAGVYTFILQTDVYANGANGSARFRLLIDGVTEVGGDTDFWINEAGFTSNERSTATFVGVATLTAGSHTIVEQWKTHSGTAPKTNSRHICVVSWPGGTATSFRALAIDANPLASSFTTTTSYVQVGPSGSVTIPASGSYRFRIYLTTRTSGGSGDGIGNYQLLVDGVVTGTTPVMRQQSFTTILCTTEIEAVLSAGTHAITIQWKHSGSVAFTSSTGEQGLQVSVEGGAAINASLDARGDSFSVDAGFVPQRLVSGGASTTMLVGAAPATGSLRGLSIIMDGTTVTAGTLTADLLADNVVKASVALDSTTNTVKVNSTDTPVILSGQRLELRVTGSALYNNAAGVDTGVMVVAYISVSTIIQSVVEQPVYAAPTSSDLTFGEEFQSTVLSGWTLGNNGPGTAQAFSQTAVDPTALFTTGPHRYDLATRPGWFLLQPAVANDGPIVKRAITIPTNCTIAARIQLPATFRTTYANSTFDFLLGFGNAAISQIAAVGLISAGNQTFVRGLVTGVLDSRVGWFVPDSSHLLTIVKLGTTFYCYWGNWFLGKGTNATTMDTLWFYAQAANAGNSDPNPVYAVEYIRIYNTVRFL